MELKVGDFVRVVYNDCNGFESGAIVKVVDTPSNAAWDFLAEGTDRATGLTIRQFMVYNEVEKI